MTAAEQERKYGICAMAHRDGSVIIKIGSESVQLEPGQARKFTFELAGAYYKAERILEAERIS